MLRDEIIFLMDEIAFDYNDCHDHKYWISNKGTPSLKNFS